MIYVFFGMIIFCIVMGLLVFGFNIWIGVMENFDYVECLFFGVLIFVIDFVIVLVIFYDFYVDFDMYVLVFGESVLNDVVVIVFYRVIEIYLVYNQSDL